MESADSLVPEADIRAYARYLFPKAEREEVNPGRIGWVLYYGYRQEAPPRPNMQYFANDIFISHLSAFLTLESVADKQECRVVISLQSLENGMYADYMSGADASVVKLILSHEKRGEMLAGQFPVTAEMLQHLCGHPNLYLSGRADKEGSDSERQSAIFLSRREPELYHTYYDELIVGVSMEDYEGVPVIRLDRSCRGKTQGCSMVCYSERNLRLLHFFRTFGIGGMLYVSKENLSLLVRFMDLFRSGEWNTSWLRRSMRIDGTLTPSIRLVVTLAVENEQISGMLRVAPTLFCHETPEPGKGARIIRSNGDKSCIVERHFEMELAQRARLLELCPTLASLLAPDANAWSTPIDYAALRIVEEISLCPPELVTLNWKTTSRKIHVQTERHRVSIFAADKSQGDRKYWVGVTISTASEQKMAALHEFLSQVRAARDSYLKGPSAYTLISPRLHVLALLSDTGSCRVKENAMSLRISRAGLLLLALAGFLDESASSEDDWQGLSGLVAPVLEQYQLPVAEPAGIMATLRPYQADGYEWMQHLLNCGCGACLADDMGLGKTLQILCVLQSRANDGPSLVVAPASVVGNWVAEAARFAPGLRMLAPGSGKELEQTLHGAEAGVVVVVGYTLLQSRIHHLSSISWNIVVLDEAQFIKNHLSARTKAAYSLKAACRIAATGTPVENNMGDLWSLFQFLNPGLLGAYTTFRSSSMDAETRGRLVAPFVLRRTKQEVLRELPGKNEKICYITLSEREKELYEVCRREIETMMHTADWMKALLPGLQRLRRMCCHPMLGFPDSGVPSSKLDRLLQMVHKLRKKNHRILIFSQFTDMLAYVRKRFEQEEVRFCYLDGSTPSARRAAVIDDFQHGRADCFLISLKAGGTGLNLTAADTVIILDPWWNPAAEDQAADRAHRIGQPREVTVYRFVCRNTIEEKVLTLKKRKLQLVDAFLCGASTAGSFTLDELRKLL